MGDTIWVDVQARDEGDLPPDSSLLLRLESHIERLSEKLHVAKLRDFYDYSVSFAAYYGDEFGDGDGVPGEQSDEAWFDPAPALAAVGAIYDHLTRHPDDLDFEPDASRQHWPVDLMDELKLCRVVLDSAVSSGRKFRFLIVP
jgi:hypothetical protein